MKQKIVLLLTALFLFGFTQAQVSKESYAKAVDFLNCKTIELSLKDDKNISEFQKKCPCGITTYTQINQFLTSVKLEATISLSNEVEGLKEMFKKNWKKTDAVTFLSESVFSDKTRYQKISAFADKRKGKLEFDNYKANLKADIENDLMESESTLTVPQTTTRKDTTIPQPSFEDRSSELENKIKTKKDDNNVLGGIADYLILFSIMLSVISLFLGFGKQSGNDNEVTNEIKSYVRKKIDETNWNRSAQNINVVSVELRDANNRIRDLETQVEKIKSQLINSNPVPSYTQPTIQEVKQPEVRPEIFFLSSPNADGSFDESSASSIYREGATIYRFNKIGNNKAKFQIDDKEASIKLALQYRDIRIDPVCEATNAFNQAKKISTVQQGEAELQSSKWVVNKKAKIKYEN